MEATKVTLQVAFWQVFLDRRTLLFLNVMQMLHINFRIGHLWWEDKLSALVFIALKVHSIPQNTNQHLLQQELRVQGPNSCIY